MIWVKRIFGITVALTWGIILIQLVGHWTGFLDRPEMNDGFIFAACCMGMAGGLSYTHEARS